MRKLITLAIVFIFATSALAVAPPEAPKRTKDQIQTEWQAAKDQYDKLSTEYNIQINALKAKLYDLTNKYDPQLNTLLNTLKKLVDEFNAIKEKPVENAD